MPPNVRIQTLNPNRIFQHLPTMKQWYRNTRQWKKGFPLNNLSNALRLAIILQKGGTYLDTDMVVVKPLTEAPSNAVGVEVEKDGDVAKKINGINTNTTTINTAAFINFEPHNPFVQRLVDRFVLEYNGSLWGHNGPGLLTRTWQDYDTETPGSEDVHLMSKKYLYPIGWHEIDRLFDNINLHENIVRLVSGSSFAVHMWQSLLMGHVKYADENSVFSHLFRFACPTTHATMFVPTRLPLVRMMPYTLSHFTAPTCSTSPVCNTTLSIQHPRVGTQYSSHDILHLQFDLGVEENEMESFQLLVDDPGRLDVCTSMDKEPFTPWCVPLSAVRSGTSSISIPPHAMSPGQHTIFALLVDRHTHETSAPTATTFNVAFRQWKLKTQGGSKFTKTLNALATMEQVEKPKVNKPGVNNSGVALDGDGGNKQDDDDGVVSVLLIHNGHRMDHIHNGHRMGHIIDMPAYNFIERGLLEAVRQHQQKGSTLHTYGPYGPGHDAYDSAMALKDNIERKWGSVHQFDAVLYLPPPWPEDTTNTLPSQVKELNHALVMFRQAETRDTALAIRRMNIIGGSILLGTYAHELAMVSHQWQRSNASHYFNRVMLAHLPHCASSNVFQNIDHHNDDQHRDIDVLLTGTLSPHVYPGRARWAKVLLTTPTALNTVVLNHPGYVIANKIEAAKQLASYASMLKRAKIIVVTPSKHGRGLAKYVEAQMAGAMIVGSGAMPNERTEYFSSFVVNMDVTNTSSTVLLEQLEWWIHHPEERHRKARIGHVHALQQTWTHWLGWLQQVVVAYKKHNVRGEWSPLSNGGMPPPGFPLSFQSKPTPLRLHHRKKTRQPLRCNRSRKNGPLPLPFDVKVGTIGCVQSDRIEMFFPSTWWTVALDNTNHQEWVDTTWVCNPLPSTIASFTFEFSSKDQPEPSPVVNMYPNVWIATNNKTNYCLHVRALYSTTLASFFMPCYALQHAPHQQELLDTIRRARTNRNTNLMFVTKPSEGSGGRGIQLVTAETLKKHVDGVVDIDQQRTSYEYAQLYLPNPMLLRSTQQRKFDFRVYGLITSFSPVPMFWLHQNGFARLSTAPYVVPTKNVQQLQQLVPHITNVHFQRNVPGYTVPKNQYDDCRTDTRSLMCMFHAIEQEKGISVAQMWTNLQKAVGKSLLAALVPLTRRRTETCHQCYQLFGIDVLIDHRGHPYVVELNASPSIETVNPGADGNVLKQVYRDTWGMTIARGGERRGHSTGRIKEWVLHSSSAAMLKDESEEQQLIEEIDVWCNRGEFDLALPPLDDFEVVGAVLQSEWRLLNAVVDVIEVFGEEGLCV